MGINIAYRCTYSRGVPPRLALVLLSALCLLGGCGPSGEIVRQDILAHRVAGSAVEGVPWQRQPTSRSCAPTVVACLYDYLGYAGHPTADTLTRRQIVAELTSRGLTVRHGRWGTFELLRDAIADQGLPIICEIQTAANAPYGHIILVTAFDADHKLVVYHDPIEGPDRTCAYDRFARLWSNRSRWYCLAIPPAGDSVAAADAAQRNGRVLR